MSDFRLARYLAIGSGPWPSDLRWSANGEAIENGLGTTVVFSGQIAEFLDGFLATRSLIPFRHVLHLLALLTGYPLRDEYRQVQDRLCRLFTRSDRPLRNAGVLCALLCEGVPAVEAAPETTELIRWLRQQRPTTQLPPLEPPLSDEQFQTIVVQRLARFSDEDITHWLRFGSAPVRVIGEEVARSVPRPPSLAERIEVMLSERERLDGAAGLTPWLSGALSLPPRRFASPSLPQGGYADVITRGDPEHLLPSQFALDGLEFVRRFADRELLYYRREDPNERFREQLVLLFDQGVRTWGVVRLTLAAALVALVRQSQRRAVTVRLGNTDRPGMLVDTDSLDDDKLAALLEGSDLTPHPGLLLERTLELCDPETMRDVVLLTHPRNLDEPDVRAAVRETGLTDRLFSVSVAESGEVALTEWRQGTPRVVSRCRVDLKQVQPKPHRPPSSASPGSSAWIGAIEPIPWPFPLGLTHSVFASAIDPSNEWLLVLTTSQVLHLSRMDGTHQEILPRGRFEGGYLSGPFQLLGVHDGFVVTGQVAGTLAVVHYDLAHRSVKGYSFSPVTAQTWVWHYLPDWHCVVARNLFTADSHDSVAVDLATGGRHAHRLHNLAGSSVELTTRARQACSLAHRLPLEPAPQLLILGERRANPRGLVVQPLTGQLTICRPDRPDVTLTPQIDGHPLLKGASILSAQLAGDVLAVQISSAARRSLLHLMDVSRSRLLTEVSLRHPQTHFQLSSDGQLLVYEWGHCHVQVVSVLGGPTVHMLAPGKCHSDVKAELGRGWLALVCGKSAHLLTWNGSVLQHTFHAPPTGHTVFRRRLKFSGLPSSGAESQPERLLATFSGDGRRFRARTERVGGLSAVVDGFGQVALVDANRQVAAMFRILRSHLAGWLPDGTRFGSAHLVGGPAAADAAERFARALQAAQP